MNRQQVTNIEVKKANRNRVFRYIYKNGTVSNPDISYEMKMSLPTVTQITRELIEKGLIEELGEFQSTGGRRAKALSVATNVKEAAGLDITRDHVSMVLINLKGEVLKSACIEKDYSPGEAYYHSVSQWLENFLDEGGADRERLLGLGISYPGIIDQEKGMATFSHVLGEKSVPLENISRYFPYPCYFLNDANAAAYVEGSRAESAERFVYMFVANMVGGAIFENYEMVQGKNFRCGEIGHMTIVPDGELCYCGKKGHLDTYCSAKRLKEAADGSIEEFFRRLDQGDGKLAGIWDRYTTYMAMAVNNIHMLLDCDVVLGGYLGRYMGDHIQDIRNKVAQRNTFEEDGSFVRACKCRIDEAALGVALKVVANFIEQI